MDFILSEVLKRSKRSVNGLVLLAFLSVIILNAFITFTNNLPAYQNSVSIMILLLYVLIMYIGFKIMMFEYVYNLGDDFINFQNSSGKSKIEILEVNFRDIIFIDKYENITVNKDIQKTYYFVYDFRTVGCYYCEYKSNGKTYRFVFRPSERLLRILERKIDRKKYEREEN